MGKQAFIITAYNDFEWLKRTVEIYAKSVDCYIHVDKKTKIPGEVWQWAKQTPGVYLYSRYRINWGSYRHISAILYLLEEAAKIGEYYYFHIVSSNSFITRSMNEVLAFFDRDKERLYMECVDLDQEDKDHVIEPWYIYYHFLHLYNKRTSFGNNFDYYFCKVQKRLGIRRGLHYRYKGLVYCHLSLKAVEYVFAYLKKNPSYMRRLKTCNIGEEFFFQNILMYSEFKEKIYPSPLLYVKWDERGVANFLREEDYSTLMQEDYLFARKFGQESYPLFERICRSMENTQN